MLIFSFILFKFQNDLVINLWLLKKLKVHYVIDRIFKYNYCSSLHIIHIILYHTYHTIFIKISDLKSQI